MQQTSRGDALIDGKCVASYELTRTYEPRPVRIPVGHRYKIVDRGVETQAYVVFPEIYEATFSARLQAMIDAQVDLAARRRLRDEGANSFLVTLAGRDQHAVEGIVTPPSFARQIVHDAVFPISLAD